MIYITVLAISTLVLVMAMGALMASRALQRATVVSSDSDDASGYAFSAVEMARYMVTADSYWRGDYTPGTWFSNTTIGKGTMSCTVSTTDNKFTNMSEDVTFLGTGIKGSAKQNLKAVLHSTITPLTCLTYVFSSGGAVSITGNPISASTAGMFSNTSVAASSATVAMAVSTAGSITGSYYQNAVLTGQTAVTLPTSSTIFSLSNYSANATAINYSSLQGSGKMEKILLSPVANPFGSANTNGIYVINCGGKNVTIDNDRIVGTLVLTNAGTVTVTGPLNWVPAVTDYPCLLVQGGTLNINLGTATLNEGGSIGNMNPSGTPYPYPSGTTNTTTTDTYPTTITGIIYTSGNAAVTGASSLGIVISAGTLSFSGGSSATITSTYDATYYSNPPPGFYNNTLTADSNTYSRSVN
ncbi:MAG TPA: hypothetical protein VGG19_18605 [Tepidisphaeraceae bacterium]